jgi:hypothetical protein
VAYVKDWGREKKSEKGRRVSRIKGVSMWLSLAMTVIGKGVEREETGTLRRGKNAMVLGAMLKSLNTSWNHRKVTNWGETLHGITERLLTGERNNQTIEDHSDSLAEQF